MNFFIAKWYLFTFLAFKSLDAFATVECIFNFPICAAASIKVFKNGNKFSDNDEVWDTAWFRGYVTGIAQTSLKAKERTWCPDRFSSNQIETIVAQYVQEHPEQWSDQPEELVKRALAKAFPCIK